MAETNPTYATVVDVERLTGINFTATSTPSIEDVEDFLLDAEDEIDYRTGHAWREASVADEYHDFPRHPIISGVSFWYPIRLHHRSVRSFDSNSGDKIEVWDGSSWTDWVSEKTEGRDEDWWCNYTLGIIWIRRPTLLYRLHACRVTYRYGETSVPRDVKRAAAMLAAIQVLRANDMVGISPDNATSITVDRKIESWKTEIDEIIARRSEFGVL